MPALIGVLAHFRFKLPPIGQAPTILFSADFEGECLHPLAVVYMGTVLFPFFKNNVNPIYTCSKKTFFFADMENICYVVELSCVTITKSLKEAVAGTLSWAN